MKIAQVAPLAETVPPAVYGGTERVVHHLTEALVAMGHEVTLFAAAGSTTTARFVPARPCPLRLDPAKHTAPHAAHLAMLSDIRARQHEFDILHFHTDLLHFPVFEPQAAQTLTTIHGRLDMEDLPLAYARWDAYPLVSLSMAQRTPLPEANWLSNVPHGIDPAPYRAPSRPTGDYLAFLGRIAPEKRPDRAIAIARKAGMPLKIAAKVDPADRLYFERIIRPLLSSSDVEFIGEIADHQKAEFLGNARALLFPIDWPEPFGLVMIEAMACGTPVIAWRHGSVPEVVDHGVTGLIVEDEDEAVAAVRRAARLDRRRIRQVFERRFTARTMAGAYEDLYARLICPTVSGARNHGSPAR